MKNLSIKEGLIRLFEAGSLIIFLAGTPQMAEADTATANAQLEKAGIKYTLEDSVATDLIVNIEDVYAEKVKTGTIPSEYDTITIDSLITLNDLNGMYETLLNSNISSLFTNPEEFKYISMGIYVDNENDKQILDGVSVLVEAFAKNPTDTATLDRLITIFTGRDSEYPTAKLSVGGKKALAHDVFFVNTLVQVYGLEEYVQQTTELSAAYGNNGDTIVYINALNDKQNCR